MSGQELSFDVNGKQAKGYVATRGTGRDFAARMVGINSIFQESV